MDTTKIIRENEYDFEVDTVTGSTVVRGNIQIEKSPRNVSMQLKAGGERRLETDHGGHLIAASQNGPAIDENHFAQDKNVNQKTMREIERSETQLLTTNENVTSIKTERIAFSNSPTSETGEMRPDTYMINDTITYTDGSEHNIYNSFTNISFSEQEQIAQEIEQLDETLARNPTPDPIRAEIGDEKYNAYLEDTLVYQENSKDQYLQPSKTLNLEKDMSCEKDL